MRRTHLFTFWIGLGLLLGGSGHPLWGQYLPDSIQADLDAAVALRWQTDGYQRSLEELESVDQKVRQHFPTDGPEVAEVAFRLGQAQYLAGQLEASAKSYQLALEVFPLLPDSGRWRDITYGLGITYREIGDLYRAEDYLRESLELVENDRPAGSDLDRGKVENALGNVLLRREDYGAAQAQFSAANEHLVAALGEDHQFIGALLGNYGVALAKSGAYAEAIRVQRRSIAIFQQTLPPNHPSQANPWTNLGEAYLRAASSPEDPRLDSAELYLQQALLHWEKNLGGDHPLMAEVRYHLGDVAARRGALSQAKDWYALAQKGLYTGKWTLEGFAADLGQVTSLTTWYEIELRWARLAVAEDSPDVMAHFVQLNAIIDALRRDFRRESTQLFWSRRALAHYEEAIAWCASHGRAEEGFGFAERARGLLLSAALRGTETARFAGVPIELLERERSLKTLVLLVERELEEAEDSTRAGWQQELDRLKKRTEALVRELEENYPAYFHLKYAHTALPVDSIQKHLPSSRTAWVQYFWGAERVYGWCISPDTVVLVDLGPTPGMRMLVEAQMNLQGSLQYHDSTSHALQNRLLGRMEGYLQDFSEWIIVRDGPLEYISFAALPSDRAHPRGRRYLLDDVAVSYAVSATTYFFSSVRPVATLSYAGLGRSFPNGLSTEWGQREIYLTSLPFVTEEIEAGHRIWGGWMGLDSAATESRFLEQGRHAQILHFATHTLYNDQHPLHSQLILTPDSAHDGRLYASELFGLELAAELAVLGACNTGKGQVLAGEGMMSLAQGFAYAGCRSILMNHWLVPDEPNAVITGAFFRYLKRGLNKSEALRQAQLDYLAAAPPVRQHPRFWATPGIVGDISPLKGTGSGSLWVIWALAALLGFLFWWQRR